jgi:hypothetical protein
VIDTQWHELCYSVIQRFEAAVTHQATVFEMDGPALVRAGIRDPVRLFVKDEPHKLAKIEAGKLRLISNESLADQLFTRVLSYLQNKAEIRNWASCPSKPGVSLDDYGLEILSTFFEAALRECGELETSDVKAWDWSVQAWELMADADRRAEMADSWGTKHHFFLKVNAHCVANSVYILPDGRLMQGSTPGIQNSGSFNTSSTNSFMRVLIDIVAKVMLKVPRETILKHIRWTAVMGDDSVLPRIQGVTRLLEEMGHSVKEVKTYTALTGISFCSHQWISWGVAAPENVYKTLFRFFSHPLSSNQYPDWWSQLVGGDFRHLHHLVDESLWLPAVSARVARAIKYYGEKEGSSSDPPSAQAPGSSTIRI